MRTPTEITASSAARLSLLGNWTMRENGESWARYDAAGRPGTFAEWRKTDAAAPKDVPPPEVGESQAEDGDHRESLDLTAHLTALGMPEVVRDVLIQGAEERPLVTAVREWWRTDRRFALLFGDSGAGKTVAACVPFTYAKVPQFWDTGRCGFITCDELARLSYFGRDSEDLLRWACRVRLLVLDDLGAELVTPAWLATLDRIVTEREGKASRRTLLTTNLSADRRVKAVNGVSAFEDRYGLRICRRIRGSGKVLAAGGP